jgi:fermentation-respiration switch protein FrsA (DUF1100 family)
MRRSLDLLVKLLIGSATLYALVAIGAFFGQRALMYVPDRRHITPAQIQLAGIEEVVLKTPDGERVFAWYGRARPGEPTILYFHGNGGSLANRSERIAKYLARGRGMFMMTYRGYGGSSGRPSERANVADALLAYDTLVARGVPAKDIVLYGESIGSGVAVQVAAQRSVAGVILDAPYTSIVDVAALAYPFLPVRPFLLDRYETMTHLPRVTAPMLVIHGERDTIIPVEMGRAVAAAAKGPARLVTFPNAGHVDHHLHGSFEAVQDWLDDLRAGRIAGS